MTEGIAHFFLFISRRQQAFQHGASSRVASLLLRSHVGTGDGIVTDLELLELGLDIVALLVGRAPLVERETRRSVIRDRHVRRGSHRARARDWGACGRSRSSGNWRRGWGRRCFVSSSSHQEGSCCKCSEQSTSDSR